MEIVKKKRRVDSIGYTESQIVEYGNSKDRFLNLSPKNFIRSFEDVSTKKFMIPMLLIEMMDKYNMIFHTLDEFSKILEYPKTGLSVLFGEYRRQDFMQKVRNGVYIINPLVAYRGSKYERDEILKNYNRAKEGI